MNTIDLGDWREAEIERYCEEAAKGKETDWIEHDEQSSLEALGLVYTALTQSLYQEGVIKRCRAIIEPLITKYAESRADDMLNDCTCYAPPVRYNTVSPPEPVRNKDCPIHGSIDYRDER